MLAVFDRAAFDAIVFARPHPEVNHLASLGTERAMAISLRRIRRSFANRALHTAIKRLRRGRRQCVRNLAFEGRCGLAIGGAAVDQEFVLVGNIREALQVAHLTLR